jgi:anti-sigma factor RsiW
MNCSPVDLKDYVFGELSASSREAVEQHVTGCAPCREELERLRVTGAALAVLCEEELPRRIAFVSDKVFEPKWWQKIWNSGPSMGFASALVLAAAILAHGLMQPAAVPLRTAAPVDQAAFEARVSEEVTKRLPEAVRQVAAQSDQKTARLIADLEKRANFERRADMVAFQEEVNYLKKRLDVTTIQLARADMGQGQ